MRSDTQSVTIEAPVDRVFAMVSDPTRLPEWAIGFAEAVTARPAGGWTVRTGTGEVALDVESDKARGTVDFHMEPARGTKVVAWSRVVGDDRRSHFLFTQAQSPGMPDEVFDAQVEAVRHELSVLKARLEVRCPA
jgi:uncharacterized protein YndB with AHSA1/START domain